MKVSARTVKLSATMAVQAPLHADSNFEQIVRDHQAMVFRTLMRLTGSREHLEDLAQDVFLRLYRALPTFRGEALLSTYLYRIIVNVAQDEWKRRRRDERSLISITAPGEDDSFDWQDRLPHPSPNAEQQFSERQFRQAIEDRLQQLSPIERTVLVLYHQEEQSYEQIAATLKMPIGTVRTHLHRGRKRLRESILKKDTKAEGIQTAPQRVQRSPA